MKCSVCNKEIPKDVYMHACHYAARRHQAAEHLELAGELLKKEKEAALAKLMEAKHATGVKRPEGESVRDPGSAGGESESFIERILTGDAGSPSARA